MQHGPGIRWIRRTLRQAAWAPLLVLCPVVLADGMFKAYTRFPWFDIPTHFLGGIAVTYFFWCASVNAQSFAGRAAKVSHAVLALGGTAAMTLLWELFEFLADRCLQAQMQHGLGDTASDIFFGLAGGVAYLVFRRGFRAASQAQAASDSPDARP